MPLSRHSLGTYPETSSHTTRQGTLDHSRLSSLSQLWPTVQLRELVSTLRKKEREKGTVPKILAREEKATTTGIDN